MSERRKVIAFAASNSLQSINKKLVTYATSLLADDVDVEILDLNDFELPLFSIEREAKLGQPELAKKMFAKITDCDAIIIAFAEHNGNYSVAYKNLFDWVSRIDPRVYQDKAMLLLATSPGGRGGQTVLEIASAAIPRFGGDIKATLSLASFNQYFDVDQNIITDESIKSQLQDAVNKLIG